MLIMKSTPEARSTSIPGNAKALLEIHIWLRLVSVYVKIWGHRSCFMVGKGQETDILPTVHSIVRVSNNQNIQQWEVLLGCKSGTVYASRFYHSFLVWRVNHYFEVSNYNAMTVGSHDIDQNLINSQMKCFFVTNNYYNMHSINANTNLRVVI